jgi:hypothetical protein
LVNVCTGGVWGNMPIPNLNVHISIDQAIYLFHRLLVFYRTLQVIFLDVYLKF